MSGKARAGRPKGSSDARQKLVVAARQMFSALPYEKVSTRMIAEKAQVSPALINYYFGAKSGLFEQMLLETMEPMRNFLHRVSVKPETQINSVEAFMRTYYRAVIPNPDLPKLVMRVMSDPEANQRSTIENVLKDMIDRVQKYLFGNPMIMKDLQADIDPIKAKMTVMSLAMFPFTVPESVLRLNGFSLDEDFLDALLEHNIQVLKKGMLSADVKS